MVRPAEIISVRQEADFVEAEVRMEDGSIEPHRGRYLIGCDGGRSLIRKAAGIEFPGWDPTMSWLIAEVQMAEEPKWGFHEDAVGIHAIGKGDGGSARIVVTGCYAQVAAEELRDIPGVSLVVARSRPAGQ